MSDQQAVRDTERERTTTPSGLPTGRLVLGGLLVVVGLLWLLDVAGVTELRWRVVLPAALTVVGLALLVTARRGAHGGLIAAGIVLSALVLVASAVPGVSPVAGVGDRTERPASLTADETSYDLAMGSLTVDLRDVDDPEDGAEVNASVGMGELVVVLPAGLGADVRARAGMGEVNIVGASQGGVGVSLDEEVAGDPVIALNLSVGMGKVEVRR
jgi:hypothetical protein